MAGGVVAAPDLVNMKMMNVMLSSYKLSMEVVDHEVLHPQLSPLTGVWLDPTQTNQSLLVFASSSCNI